MQNFILCTADAPHISGRKISALEITEGRIKKMKWPIYRNTRNRKAMNEGDSCVLYVGGTGVGAGTFFGEFTIGKITPNISRINIDHEDMLTDFPDTFLEIIDFKKCQQDILAKPIMKKLSFFPKNEMKWGVVLMGGCRKIGSKDYSILSACLK